MDVGLDHLEHDSKVDASGGIYFLLHHLDDRLIGEKEESGLIPYAHHRTRTRQKNAIRLPVWYLVSKVHVEAFGVDAPVDIGYSAAERVNVLPFGLRVFWGALRLSLLRSKQQG